jgi:Ribbon-helix-helix protein, copG family
MVRHLGSPEVYDPCMTMAKPVDLDYDPRLAEIRPVVIRMPAELHAAIKAKAAKDHRSMAQAIRLALRSYVEAR